MEVANKLVDISVGLGPDLPLWPGSTGLSVQRIHCLEKGHRSNVSKLTCDVHSGTHIDAPLHFISQGKSVTQIPLDVLIGDAYVAYLPDIRTVTDVELSSLDIPLSTQRLLLRTDNSRLWDNCGSYFQCDYVALSLDAAKWIVNRGIRLIGIDYLSVEPFGERNASVHVALLSGGVTIVEGLNLSDALPGLYELVCLPLKLVGAEGAPARAVLKSKNSVE